MTEPHPQALEHMARHAWAYDATRWAFLHGRRQLANGLPAQAAPRILEVGCGSGRVLAMLRRRFPDAQLFGLDPSAPMLERARRRRLNATLILGTSLPDGPFDAVVFSYALTMMERPDAALDAAEARLRPGGRLGVLDFLAPRGPVGRWWFGRYPLQLTRALRENVLARGTSVHDRVRRSPWGLWHWFLAVVTCDGVTSIRTPGSSPSA